MLMLEVDNAAGTGTRFAVLVSRNRFQILVQNQVPGKRTCVYNIQPEYTGFRA